MDQDANLSTDLAWWLVGAAALLLVLISPRLRRRRRDDAVSGKHASASSPSGGAEALRGDAGPVGPDRRTSPAQEDAALPDDASTGQSASLRLDAARVYLDLGDNAGAEAMLEQVAEDGDEDERAAASAMRRELEPGRESSTDEAPDFDAENLLDLATAYVEIGDAESARRMVERIERAGSESQRAQARALLERL